jgi:ABC-2 type transport system ATP-binding protein
MVRAWPFATSAFSLRPGQVLGYLGPNGAGKSTTVKILTGLLDPSDGQVLCDGQDIRKDLAGYRKRLGYVPEEANLYPYLTGEEYLDLVATLRAMPSRRQKKAITSLFRLFSLWPYRHLTLGAYQGHAATHPADCRADG